MSFDQIKIDLESKVTSEQLIDASDGLKIVDEIQKLGKKGRSEATNEFVSVLGEDVNTRNALHASVKEMDNDKVEEYLNHNSESKYFEDDSIVNKLTYDEVGCLACLHLMNQGNGNEDALKKDDAFKKMISDLLADPDGAPVDPDGAPVDPDGAPVDPDGAPVDPDGAPVDPDGAPVDPDGAPVDPDGAPVDPDGAPVDPDGAPVDPDGAPVDPDGAPVDPDGAPVDPDGAPVDPDGAPVDPDGAPVDPDGAPVDPDGAPVDPDGAPVDPDGAPVDPDGAPVDPDGAPVDPDGAPVDPDGAPVDPDGAPVDPDGAPVDPDGAPVDPDGAPVDPDGAPVDPDGAPVDPDGAPVDPDGADPLVAGGTDQSIGGNIFDMVMSGPRLVTSEMISAILNTPEGQHSLFLETHTPVVLHGETYYLNKQKLIDANLATAGNDGFTINENSEELILAGLQNGTLEGKSLSGIINELYDNPTYTILSKKDIRAMSDEGQKEWFESMMKSGDPLELDDVIVEDGLDEAIQANTGSPSETLEVIGYITSPQTKPHFTIRQGVMYGDYPKGGKLQDQFLKVDNNGKIQYFTIDGFKNQKTFKKFDDQMSRNEERKNRIQTQKEVQSKKIDMNKYIEQKFGITPDLLKGLGMTTIADGQGGLNFIDDKGKSLLHLDVNFSNLSAATTLPKNGDLMYSTSGSIDDLTGTIQNQLMIASLYNKKYLLRENNETTGSVKKKLTFSLAFLDKNVSSLITGNWTTLGGIELSVGGNKITKDSTTTIDQMSIGDDGALILSDS